MIAFSHCFHLFTFITINFLVLLIGLVSAIVTISPISASIHAGLCALTRDLLLEDRSNLDKYEIVEKLPKGAKPVADYCKEQGYTTSNLYNRVRYKKNKKYKVVVFQGFNFVIPA